MKYITFFTFFYIPSLAFSFFPSSFYYSKESTSDLLITDSFNLNFQQQFIDISYPYLSSQSGLFFGADYKSVNSQYKSYSLTGKEFTFLTTFLNDRLDEHMSLYLRSYNVTTNNYTKSFLLPEININKIYNGAFLKLDIKKAFIYEGLLLDRIHPLESSSGHFTYAQTINSFRVNMNLSHNEYSDNNIKNNQTVKAFYGATVPWIWIGLKGESLANSIQQSAYWSPLNYNAYGIVLEYSNFLSDQLSFSFEGQYLSQKEDSFNYSAAQSYLVMLSYGKRDFNKIDFSYSKTLSLQSESKWFSDTYKLLWSVHSF